MTHLMILTAAWGAAMLGIYLVIYTLIKWRRAARACHPMPFRRRSGLSLRRLPARHPCPS